MEVLFSYLKMNRGNSVISFHCITCVEALCVECFQVRQQKHRFKQVVCQEKNGDRF
jgi:hypothetical protein